MASLTSLEDLNSRISGKPVSMRNFRPNFIIGGVPRAFDEDNWKYVRIGNGIILRRTHSCGRCKQTTCDPDTGIFRDEPIKTLRTYRCFDRSHPDAKNLSGQPVFGVQMNCEVHGSVAVGDPVYVVY